MARIFTILLLPALFLSACPNAGTGGGPETGSIVNGIAPSFRGVWGDHTEEDLHAAFDRVAELPLELIHVGVDWGGMVDEDSTIDWAHTDLQMNRISEMARKASLIVSAIEYWPEQYNGDLLGEGFTSAYIAHARAVLDRYDPTIQYFWVDNEVNLQIDERGLDVVAYVQFFNAVQQALEESHPSVDVGVILTYAYDSTADDISDEEATVFALLEELSPRTLIGITFYPQFLGLEAADGAASLSRVDDFLAPYNLRYGITETGWSTAGHNASPEAQTTFYRDLARISKDSPSREFLYTWGLYDPQLSPEHKEYLPDSSIEWLESLGLIDQLGTPHPAWTVYKQELEERK